MKSPDRNVTQQAERANRIRRCNDLWLHMLVEHPAISANRIIRYIIGSKKEFQTYLELFY